MSRSLSMAINLIAAAALADALVPQPASSTHELRSLEDRTRRPEPRRRPCDFKTDKEREAIAAKYRQERIDRKLAAQAKRQPRAARKA